jgi:ribosomal protein S27AE
VEARCRECGSERIAPNLRVDPRAGAGSLLARLRAWVCADCGYTELHADDPLALYLAHMKEVGGQAASAAAGADRPSATGAPTANIQCPSCGSVLPAAATVCDVCGWSQEAPGA